MKKLLPVLLALVLASTAFTGCSKDNASADDAQSKKETSSAKSEAPKEKEDEKVTISVGNWPADNNPELLAHFEKKVEEMKAAYPNVTIKPDGWAYSVDSFLPKASSNQLPTVFNTWFPDITKIVGAGYARDITTQMDKNGFTEAMQPQIKELVSKDKKIFAKPEYAYVMGLNINMKLFTDAGLLNEDGTAKIPQTYEELAQTAATIKEKTGQAGMALPTINNTGGWHFMNIAWSFGTEFMKQKDGKWESAFNSPEGIAALQYVKDLKWKYKALPDNALMDAGEVLKLYATDQAAMCFADPGNDAAVTVYNMSKDNVSIGTMPAGPKGKFTLMGGGVTMVAPNATEEETDAVFAWSEVMGGDASYKIDAKGKESLEDDFKLKTTKNIPIGFKSFSLWQAPERAAVEAEVRAKYTNINVDLFKEFNESKDTKVHTEEPVCCQELYKTLDGCIQAVLTDESADPAALMAQAASDFQKNYLDNLD